MLAEDGHHLEVVDQPEVHALLLAQLGFRVAICTRIPLTFNNNRVYRLASVDGQQIIAKVYYRDERRRLQREYNTLRLLNARGLAGVPTALAALPDRDLALYSCEPGVCLPASEYTPAIIAAIASIAVRLHGVLPEGDAGHLPAAVGSGLSLQQSVDRAQSYLESAASSFGGADSHPRVQQLARSSDPIHQLRDLLDAYVARVPEEDRVRAIALDQRRLTSGDPAPHNVLIAPDGTVCLIDWENSGWDHPLNLPSQFLAADTALDLRPELAAAFWTAVRDGYGLPSSADRDFARTLALSHLFWCAIHLRLTTPAQIQRKQFANPDMDVDATIASQLQRFEQRLALARQAVRALGDV